MKMTKDIRDDVIHNLNLIIEQQDAEIMMLRNRLRNLEEKEEADNNNEQFRNNKL
jgi:uncharacterized coiled-coil protein SlyX